MELRQVKVLLAPNEQVSLALAPRISRPRSRGRVKVCLPISLCSGWCTDKLACAGLTKGHAAWVKRKVVLTSDLRGPSVDDQEENEGPDGSQYCSVHYDLVVSIGSAGMEFSVESHGKKFSVTDVDYE
jgi:hypothetical protein